MSNGTWCKDPRCRAFLAEGVDYCPKCGKPLKAPVGKIAWQIFTVLFSLFALWTYFHFK